MTRLRALLAASLLIAGLAACAPKLAPPGPGPTEPRLELAGLTDERAAAAVVADDGLVLPLRAWLPRDPSPDAGAPEGRQSAQADGVAGRESAAGLDAAQPRAVVLALHGFNDHSNAFAEAAPALTARGIAVYAYDQRGFGAGANPGLWAGGERMAADARQALRLLARRHPGVPLYLLGESMGGAIALLAAREDAPHAPSESLPGTLRGVILAAPAVWSSELQPWYQRWGLWLAVRLVPGLRPSGRGTDIQASDNIEALRALGRDPLVIKYSRLDTVQGLVRTMGRALEAAPAVERPVLLLYGEKDELIPRRPVERLWDALPETPASRLLVYPEGWHLLLRDLQAPVVYDDIAAWIANPALPPPSLPAGRAEPAFGEQ